ncbi:hypothetical protein SALBM135S_00859 [Streptomyces alboniger]
MDPKPGPRREALRLARQHADNAVRLAETAEYKVGTVSERHRAAEFAEVGALYAAIARSYAAIAQATPAKER